MSVSRRSNKRNVPNYPRVARVNELLREVIAEAIERIADEDNNLELVTVTAVETEPNLSSATVFISSVADDSLDSLELVRTRIQGLVASEVRLKRTPQLHFVVDEGVTNGSRIDEILRKIARESENKSEM